jgi:hypothetical protein
MHHKRDHAQPSLPVSNYGSAIARAVEWLGDRYLLAKPINHPQTRVTGDHALAGSVARISGLAHAAVHDLVADGDGAESGRPVDGVLQDRPAEIH